MIVVSTLLNQSETAANEGRCESFENQSWISPFGTLKTCLMEGVTSIDNSNFEISSGPDETVTGLGLKTNKKIKFLPVRIALKFPELVGFSAYECSLTLISRENFRGLRKLRILYLYNNAIENLPADVFQDLVSLEELHLSIKFFHKSKRKLFNILITDGNKIKLLTREIFLDMNKLRYLNLWLNQIKDIPRKTFTDLKQMEILFLSKLTN